MRQGASAVIVVQSTDTHTSITGVSLTCGLRIWKFQSRQTKRLSVWLWSKSHGWQRLRVIEVVTVMWMLWLTYRLQLNWQRQIRVSSMPIRKLQTKQVWCSICKEQYRDTNPLHRTPAIWAVVSETADKAGRTRYYCQPHANEAQTWVDGTIWTFRQQLDYAKGKEPLNGMGLEQL
jgi:hypothetical protein